MRVRSGAATVIVVATLVGGAGPAAARSLSSKLHQFISNVTIPLAVDVVEPITPVVQRVAADGFDFPVTSTAPGFTYSYNPDLGLFERSSGSLGPIFAERAETVGRHRFDLGFSYLYANQTDDGSDNFGEELFFGSEADAGGSTFAGAFRGTDFSLASHVFSFSGTFGITDRWDVNLVVPLVYTTLELKGNAAAAVQDASGGVTQGAGFVTFSDFFSNDAFGVGDILVRTKYRFWDEQVRMAGLLTLRTPTGDQDNFQGLGDFTVTPGVVASRAFGRHELHGQLGVEYNTGDVQRSRAHYGVGVVVQPWERLAFPIDVIGSSGFEDDDFTIAKGGAVVPDFTLLPSKFVRGQTSSEVLGVVPRTDVVDIAVGFKFAITGTAVVFASAIVPLTNDGLHAQVIPAGGIEVSF